MIKPISNGLKGKIFMTCLLFSASLFVPPFATTAVLSGGIVMLHLLTHLPFDYGHGDG
jgi:hypothetical protein